MLLCAGTDIYTATITATVATVIARAAGAGGGALSWITINGEKIDCCHFEYPPPTQKNDRECMLKIDREIVYAEFHELTKRDEKIIADHGQSLAHQ